MYPSKKVKLIFVERNIKSSHPRYIRYIPLVFWANDIIVAQKLWIWEQTEKHLLRKSLKLCKVNPSDLKCILAQCALSSKENPGTNVFICNFIANTSEKAKENLTPFQL